MSTKVNCPRCGEKTEGRLYMAKYTSVKVCKPCSNELRDRGFRMRRVR